ncbi:MAG: XRE family transcriptional regulator [Burkholderiaceae bacterium]|nr:XRE family transcriptional regulator [Burkholderiaceae bacterium]
MSRATRAPRRRSALSGSPRAVEFGERELRALGAEFRSLREQRGWTLRRMASESGISVAAIQNIEGGGVNPSLFTMLQLAEILDQSLDRLVAAARKAVETVHFAHGVLPRTGPVAELAQALHSSVLAARLVTVPGRQEVRELDIEAPFFAYLLEGNVECSFEDGRTERLRAHDSIHVLDRAPLVLKNPLAKAVRLLCFTDLRGQPPLLDGYEIA